MKCPNCPMTLFKKFCFIALSTQSHTLYTNSTNRLTSPSVDAVQRHVVKMTYAPSINKTWKIMENGTFTPSYFKTSNGTYLIDIRNQTRR